MFLGGHDARSRTREAIDNNMSRSVALDHGALVESDRFLCRMRSVRVRVEGNVPDGGFWVWSEPSNFPGLLPFPQLDE